MNEQVSPERRLIEGAVADIQPLVSQGVLQLESAILALKSDCTNCTVGFDAVRRLCTGRFHPALSAAQTTLENQDLLILMMQGGDPNPGRVSNGNFRMQRATELRRRLSLVTTALTVLSKSLSGGSTLTCADVQERLTAMADLLNEKTSIS